MFFMGSASWSRSPLFKTITHLPPFMGILFGLGILWLVGDLVHRKKEDEDKQHLTLVHALSRIDMSSIVFFIGILLAVATLEHTHILTSLAQWLDQAVGRQDVIVLIIGLVSAIVDNVPLVAASMGMYSLTQYPPDHFLWEFLAYCAGTGGSILIIGSAAGVAAMGLEKIHFFWYVKRRSAAWRSSAISPVPALTAPVSTSITSPNQMLIVRCMHWNPASAQPRSRP
jgi:Na+/H+ antiporter NhaD/arsenite permease-like protein